MIVVIPSNRMVDLGYLSPLIQSGARFIVVDDSPGRIEIEHPSFQVYNWEDRKRILGKNDELFPRRNGACRNFGFLMAWREAADDEVIVALDDDCEILSPTFAAEVEACLSRSPRPELGDGRKHLNVLDLYADIPESLFPRGFPYEHRATYQRANFSTALRHESPAFNVGLWTDAFDVNAIDKIQGPQWRYPQAKLAAPSAVVPTGSLVSVCSMNMQFRRKVLPAVFQFPMHVPVMAHWVIDRYGDIWGGFLLKMLMDRIGDLMTVGSPMIAHRKAGDTTRNIWQEHISHLVNLEVIETLQAAVEKARASNYLSLAQEVAEDLKMRAGNNSIATPYLRHAGDCLAAWCEELERSPPFTQGRSAQAPDRKP